MWLEIENSLEAYHEQSVQLKPAETANPSELRDYYFVLYRRVSATNFSTTIGKKPVAVFYLPGSREKIPEKQWTDPMKEFALQQIKSHPVPEVGVKWRAISKVLFTLAGLALVVGGFMLLKALLVDLPNSAAGKEDFQRLPQTGDRYYVNIFGLNTGQAGQLQSAWIEVSQMHADSTGRIRLGKQMYSSGRNNLEKDTENFRTDEIPVRFELYQNGIRFKGLDAPVTLEASVRSDRFDEYKIPAPENK